MEGVLRAPIPRNIFSKSKSVNNIKYVGEDFIQTYQVVEDANDSKNEEVYVFNTNNKKYRNGMIPYTEHNIIYNIDDTSIFSIDDTIIIYTPKGVLTGDVMRGEYLETQLQLKNNTEKTDLFKVEFVSELSR